MTVFCASASSKVLVFDGSSVAQTRMPLLAVPTKDTLVGSNSESCCSSSGSMIAPGMMAAIEVPSLGAVVLR